MTFFDETVDNENYVKMLGDEFLPFLDRNNLLEISHLMQDGATPHTCNASLDYLHGFFGERIISGRYRERYGYGLTWPSYSPDMNPCDFFLWGYLKDRVYRNRPTTIIELKQAILDEAANIPADVLARTINNFKKRCEGVRLAKGRHIEHTRIMRQVHRP